MSVALGLLGVAGLAWLSLLFEMPPPGDGCYFEIDVGSGPIGTGTEGIDWNFGLFPGRVCEYELDGLGEPQVYARTSLVRDLWPFVAAVLAVGAYVLFRSVSWLSRRVRRRDGNAP